jgi:hypothetical protein
LYVPVPLFANRCTWAHTIAVALAVLGRAAATVLTIEERMGLAGQGDPHVIARPA